MDYFHTTTLWVLNSPILLENFNLISNMHVLWCASTHANKKYIHQTKII